jgi:formamidase
MPTDTADTCHGTIYVDRFTDGVLDPAKPMLGPVRNNGYIVANTAPGCWGPMITPALKGGHEVTQPVAVEGAVVGDAIAIRIRDIRVTSIVTASGNDQIVSADRFVGDPYVARRCPKCGTLYPETRVEGIGPTAVHCTNCGAEIAPFNFTNGYTIAFDSNYAVGVTVDQKAAELIAQEATKYSSMPEHSAQHSILTFAPHDLVGVVARLRPFMGQLGTTPAVRIPDSHNAGDFGSFLLGAPHEYGLTAEQLEHRTDGHMDIDAARVGAILLCPVKVPGGGVYMGDMHAFQGDGEIAGHTADVAGLVTLQVHLLKGLKLEGPVLFPVMEDLPFLAKPLSPAEQERAETVARTWGMAALEETAPISVIGSGANLNIATTNGLERAARLLDMTVPEVMNRATITGAIEIGRHPGVVQVTFRAPLKRLERLGLLPFVKDQYGIG